MSAEEGCRHMAVPCMHADADASAHLALVCAGICSDMRMYMFMRSTKLRDVSASLAWHLLAWCDWRRAACGVVRGAQELKKAQAGERAAQRSAESYRKEADAARAEADKSKAAARSEVSAGGGHGAGTGAGRRQHACNQRGCNQRCADALCSLAARLTCVT